ncbi:MAG: gamma-glutamyltransferase [Proteobacteria bacterium]|nr:gamma-glutamyltransferase [Pseudomonadota bacterium]MBI3496178.1 gamma-glutamyltransferase [Pseudomonadota bacterium]
MYGRRPTIASVNGMVAAAHPLAAQAGARLLAEGGSAFDAAAATAAALNVVEPYMSSLGGMGLAICYVAAEKRIKTLDFVPCIPNTFPAGRFTRREELARGASAVGTPGNLAGWAELVGAHGKKPFKQALQPAIRLARDGFPLIEFNMAMMNEVVPELRRHPPLFKEWSRVFQPGGGWATPGQVLKQPDLARTYEAIAEEGPDHLYKGKLGRAVVAHLQKLGGTLNMDDLASMRPEWRDPIKASYRGLVVHTVSPPCEGFQMLLALRILDGFDLARLERNGVEHLDLVYRAIRLAAGLRLAFNNPKPKKLAELLLDAHIEALRSRVRDGRPISRPTEQWTEPAPGEDPGHTTSFSIADRDGNLVCVTQSIGAPFGSGIVVPGTGVTLNNFLFWADVNPKSPNLSKPGDALPMCMAPTLSLKGRKPVLALGTPGSYGILQTQVQALVQHLDYGLPIQAAIEAPRARLWDGRRIQVEGRIDGSTIYALRTRGHDIEPFDPWTYKVGGMQAIQVDPATGTFTGAADPRRDGYVVPV